MDLQRTLLIGAIAVLSFMLLTEWVAFSEQRAEQHSVSTTTVATGKTAEFTIDPDMHTEENNSEEDLPKEQKLDAPAAVDAPVFNANVIRIDTDVLHIEIDPEGGDIIHVALIDYHEKLNTPDRPFLLLQRDEQRYYVAQSGLVGADGIDSKGRASFTSAQSSYQLNPGEEKLQVDLVYRGQGAVQITKRFTFRPGDYLIDVDYLVDNRSGERWQANLFGQIKRDSSGDPSASTSGGIGVVPFLGTAVTQPDKRFTKFDFEDMAEKPFKAQLPGGWIAMIQHYFLSAWIPASEQSHNYSTRVTRSGYNIGGFTSPALVVDPGQSGTTGARFYAGPKDQYRLKEISPYLELSVDYGWLWWIAQPLFWLLTNIFALVGNWGTSIILLTILIKALFFQLSATSYKSMANMRRVQPKMADIKERHAEDKQKQSQAMMELYKKEKINPLGGCLPILVQMPVFIALYWTLMESVELRQAPFYGWIQDLSAMDPYFVLPLLMGGSMWFQQRLNPPPPDPMQAKVMQWMPIVFTFFFLWFPAGLVLYWVANNLLSITQQWVITRQIEKGAAKD
jgi:YidC/Oxa1 family membrane protein insertase